LPKRVDAAWKVDHAFAADMCCFFQAGQGFGMIYIYLETGEATISINPVFAYRPNRTPPGMNNRR
jgi:hypothetical protein